MSDLNAQAEPYPIPHFIQKFVDEKKVIVN